MTINVDPRLTAVDDCLYRVATRALIVHDGKLLLVRENDALWWNFPGGGVDYGESIFEALPRELAEELDLSAEQIDCDYNVAYVATGGVVSGVPRANLFFKVNVAPEHVKVGVDVAEIGWFAPSDIDQETIGRAAGGAEGDVERLTAFLEAAVLKI